MNTKFVICPFPSYFFITLLNAFFPVLLLVRDTHGSTPETKHKP